MYGCRSGNKFCGTGNMISFVGIDCVPLFLVPSFDNDDDDDDESNEDGNDKNSFIISCFSW